MTLIRISIALYRCLLLAYPAAHRRAYGPLMLQLFRDLCREAGSAGLARLWIRTVPDLAASLAAAYWEAAEEALMMLNRSVAPAAWGPVGLVVVPGLLFGLARVIGPLGWPAGLSILLVALLALGGFVVRRRLPVWGLLALGLITGWAMQWLSLWLPGKLPQALLGLRVPAAADLGVRLLTSPATQQAVVAFPLWLITFWLLWHYRQPGRLAAGALLLAGLAGVGAAFLVDGGTLLAAALVGLPLALGLPLARRYGSLAALFTLGALSQLVLADSDYYGGRPLTTQPLYPLYVILLVWLLVSVAPLLLLRAQTLRGRAIGLLAPALLWGAARVAVPLLYRPAPPAWSVWGGEALLSAIILLTLALALHLYAPLDTPAGPSQPAFTV